jgi:starch synthase
MKIAFAASEAFPFAKTGGLGDVVGSLPKALQKLGHDVKVFIPNYDSISHSEFFINYVHSIGEIPIRVNGTVHSVHLHMAHLPGSTVETYFVDYPGFFHRGELYTDDPDEDERFILFSKAVIEGLQRLQWKPDVIHCNDWQTGLIPLYIKDNYSWDSFFEKTATVMTIHNLAYQGRFPKESMYKAEIRETLYFENSPIEVWEGKISFLKTGLMFADALNTVSETYASEITTPAYGEGLDGVLRYRINDLRGILNGVDYSHWNPETDSHIPFHYSRDDLTGKYKTKDYLRKELGLATYENTPLIGIVSRMVNQKGFDLVAESLIELMGFNMQWVILGTGEPAYQEMFQSLANALPGKVSATIGYSDELAHLIEAGSDMFLMPSRFEPCGLNQIYSLKYGTIPIVRKTGGLADTVQDWHEYKSSGRESGTGFSFNDFAGYALVDAVKRANEMYYQKHIWNKIMMNGMSKNYSWTVSAEKYVDLYKHARKVRKEWKKAI